MAPRGPRDAKDACTVVRIALALRDTETGKDRTALSFRRMHEQCKVAVRRQTLRLDRVFASPAHGHARLQLRRKARQKQAVTSHFRRYDLVYLLAGDDALVCRIEKTKCNCTHTTYWNEGALRSLAVTCCSDMFADAAQADSEHVVTGA